MCLNKGVQLVDRKVSFLYKLDHFHSISDSQPPSFGASCPSRPLQFYAEKGRFSALVNWTNLVATDNSGLTPKLTSNYQSPHRFSRGTHVITYTAVDQSGNKATCTFIVKVTGTECIKNSCHCQDDFMYV